MRNMTNGEIAVVKKLLHSVGLESAQRNEFLHDALVEPMEDGSMGSIRFVSKNTNSKLIRPLVQAKFRDTDDVLVSVVLLVNEDKELAELDVWKVDFSPIESWPSPEAIVVDIDPV